MMPRRNERHRGQTDAELVSALAAGDVDALGGLYDRHYAGLLRFVRRIVVPSHDAEDVAQEAFLVLTRNAASFDVAQRFRPWLFGIAARIVLQRRRARARFARFTALFGHAPKAAPASPEALHEQSDAQAALRRALAALTPEKRIVVTMSELEDMSCDEIAAALAIPVGTVWTRRHHARRELRKILERSAP